MLLALERVPNRNSPAVGGRLGDTNQDAGLLSRTAPEPSSGFRHLGHSLGFCYYVLLFQSFIWHSTSM